MKNKFFQTRGSTTEKTAAIGFHRGGLKILNYMVVMIGVCAYMCPLHAHTYAQTWKYNGSSLFLCHEQSWKNTVLMVFYFTQCRLFGKGKRETEGRLLEPSEDVDDLDLVVDFGGYRMNKSQNQSQQMTRLWTSIDHWSLEVFDMKLFWLIHHRYIHSSC